MPKLSIILPVYNCETYARQAIESILNQTYADFELLIADDGSVDRSRSIIDECAAQDARIRVSHNEKNCGKVDTVNKLLRLCSGDFLSVHDADDFSSPDRFERQIACLEADPELVMCGTSFRVETETGELFQNIEMPADYDVIQENIKEASQFHGPTMVIRSAYIKELLYRPFFDGYNEDCDLAFRLIEMGRCTNLHDILYTYRILPGSLSKTITPRKKNMYKMAVAFHEQRLSRGTDDLMEGRSQDVDDRLNLLMIPYRKDPSLIYRENAAFLMYYQLNRYAIIQAWKACLMKPLHFNNWRTLQYCIRKSFLEI